ncbi:hypothetical protein ACLOJK_033327 [Asimina triloba]
MKSAHTSLHFVAATQPSSSSQRTLSFNLCPFVSSPADAFVSTLWIRSTSHLYLNLLMSPVFLVSNLLVGNEISLITRWNARECLEMEITPQFVGDNAGGWNREERINAASS